MHADELYINNCFEAGANGYLLKDFKKQELYSAIDHIMKGEKFISRSVSQILADNYINKEYLSYPFETVYISFRDVKLLEVVYHFDFITWLEVLFSNKFGAR